MKALAGWFKKLSPGQQLLVVVILIFVIWYVATSVKAWLAAKEASIKGNAEISVLQGNGVKATYGQDTYDRFADVLYDSMDGAGTKTDLVLKTFSYLNNDIDFIKLYTAFGIREASDNMFSLLESEDLSGWVRGDLSTTDVQNLNKQLKMKGLTKQI